MTFLAQRNEEWVKSSQIIKHNISQLNQMFPLWPNNKIVYFINLPDSVNGPPWNAYLYRGGVERMVEYSYGFFPHNIRYREIQKSNDSQVIVYQSGNLYLSEGKIEEEKQVQE